MQLPAQKHMVEVDILFTNCLTGKWEILVEVVECYLLHREDMVQTGCVVCCITYNSDFNKGGCVIQIEWSPSSKSLPVFYYVFVLGQRVKGNVIHVWNL